MPRVILFDVNETLLDLAALDPYFARVFGDAAARREWFDQLLQSAMTSTIVRDYRDFTTLGQAALHMIAARRGLQLSDAEQAAILNATKALPPHPDVEDALKRLRSAGLRLATLSNSTLATSQAQLTHAGLRPYFEQILSADSVRRLKPAAEPYRMAAQHLGVAIGDVRMVAAHAWDIVGALHAGCAGAFLARPGKVLDPAFPPPDVVATSMGDLAEQIVAVEKP